MNIMGVCKSNTCNIHSYVAKHLLLQLCFVKYMYLNCLCVLLEHLQTPWYVLLPCFKCNIVSYTLVDDESDDELSTGAAVAISIVVTFIITLVVTALISVIITNMCYKYRCELRERLKWIIMRVLTLNRNIHKVIALQWALIQLTELLLPSKWILTRDELIFLVKLLE